MHLIFSNGDTDAALEIVDKMTDAGVPLEKNTCQLAVDVAVTRGDKARLDVLLGRWWGAHRGAACVCVCAMSGVYIISMFLIECYVSVCIYVPWPCRIASQPCCRICRLGT